MDDRATGLILRTRPLTETSLIVQWLTPDLGRVATVAKGASRPKSPFRGKLDLFYRADFSFARSRRSDLHVLREVVLRDTHEALRHELAYVRQASYAAALIEQTTETETPVPGLFRIFSEMLDGLPQRPPEPLTLFAFEIRLLNESGLRPDLAGAKLSAGTQQILGKLLAADWPDRARLKLSAAQTREISHYLHGFLIFHLGKIPRSRAAALADE